MSALEPDRKIADSIPQDMGIDSPKPNSIEIPYNKGFLCCNKKEFDFESLTTWGKLSFVDKAITTLTRALIYVITHVRALSSKSDNETKALSSHLWAIYDAEHRFELTKLMRDAGLLAQDVILVPAQKEIIQTALDMSLPQYRAINQFDVENIQKYMTTVVWSHNEPKDGSTLLRRLRPGLQDEQTKELIPIVKRYMPRLGKYYPRMQKSFTDLRKALYNHQNSLSRVWAGTKADKELQNALEEFRKTMTEFGCEADLRNPLKDALITKKIDENKQA